MEPNKLIPFPAPAQTAPAETNQCRSRVLVRIGKQVIAIEIACSATVLRRPATPVTAEKHRDGQRRKEARP